MRIISNIVSGLAVLATLPLLVLWFRSFVFLEFGRWLSSLRVLALAALISGALALAIGETGLSEVVGSAALIVGVLFWVSQIIAKQPKKDIAVSIGQPIINFIARDDRGLEFRLDSLKEQAYLLKFYRGYWCPYCRLELRAWGAFAAELQVRDLKFIALSPDTPQDIRRFMGPERKFGMLLLSDSSLRVIDLFNLRSYKTIALGLGRRLRRPLAIPTTLLVDKQGIVRWIDQSVDHQVRSNPYRVLPLIDKALGA